jgi:hypothetical protein
MLMPKLNASPRLFLAVALMALPTLACNVRVKQDAAGEDKKVDIETPVGALHVSQGAEVRDVGLPVYPGARLKEKQEPGHEKSANVNISSNLFGLKVVAMEYESRDAPEKLIAFYKDKLKKYGKVLECHTSKHGGSGVEMKDNDEDAKAPDELKCEDNSGGKVVELRVGTRHKQHIVAIDPQATGTDFALVFVQMRGKDTI